MSDLVGNPEDMFSRDAAQMFHKKNVFDQLRDKTNDLVFASSKDFDHPAHQHQVISFGAWIISLVLSNSGMANEDTVVRMSQ